jgi:hypothetical protein
MPARFSRTIDSLSSAAIAATLQTVESVRPISKLVIIFFIDISPYWVE